MTIKTMVLAMLASAATLSASSQAASVIHTSAFIASPTNFNGFEGLGSTIAYKKPYSEGGILVSYSGTGKIWSFSQAGEGQYSWYPDRGAFGYTVIKLANSRIINEIQFLAGSGYYGGGANLAYELLYKGVVVETGVVRPLSGYPGFSVYGFSGIAFNEVHLQGAPGATAFDASAFEVGAYDAIAITGATVPEPAGWALMIGGFGLAGAAMRRRRAMAPLHA